MVNISSVASRRREQLFDRALLSPNEVRRECTATIKLSDTSADDRLNAMIAIGWANYTLGSFDDATTSVTQASLLIHSDNNATRETAIIDVARLEAAVLSAKGEFDQVDSRLSVVIKNEPDLNRARLFSSLGQVRAAKGNFASAIHAVDQGLADARLFADHRSEAALLVNRAVAQMELGQFAKAESDLANAKQIAHKISDDSVLATAAHNLGVIYARRGHLIKAMVLFDEAAQFLRSSGGVVALAHASLDQSELLLDAGLFDEASERATTAFTIFERCGSSRLSIAARMQIARTSAGAGHWAAAAAHARQGVIAARALGDDTQAITDSALQEFNALRIIAAIEIPGSGERTVDAAKVVPQLKSARSGTLVDGAILLRGNGHTDMSQQLLKRCISKPPRSVPRQLDHLVAKAILAEMDGRSSEAYVSANEGLKLAEAFAVTLGISELRVMTERRVRQLANVAIKQGLQRQDDAAVLGALEQMRSVILLPEPPTSDRELGHLARLRVINKALGENKLSQSKLLSERAILENQLKTSRRIYGSTSTISTLPKTDPHLPPNTFYLFHFEGWLWAICRASESPIGAVPIADFAELRRKLASLHLTLAANASPLVDLPVASLVAGISQLLAPLLDLFTSDVQALIVPEPTLQNIPWTLLTDTTVIHAPTLALHAYVQGQPTDTSRLGSAIFAGPDLSVAVAETEAIQIHLPEAQIYTDTQAIADHALREFKTAGLVHFATHGNFRTSNPLHSSVLLADGPLTLYELLAADPPNHLVFSACDIGQSASSSALGLAPLLMSRGCRGIVASTGPTGDVSACLLMSSMYEYLASGSSLAEALAKSQRLHQEQDPTVALFSTFGES